MREFEKKDNSELPDIRIVRILLRRTAQNVKKVPDFATPFSPKPRKALAKELIRVVIAKPTIVADSRVNLEFWL